MRLWSVAVLCPGSPAAASSSLPIPGLVVSFLSCNSCLSCFFFRFFLHPCPLSCLLHLPWSCILAPRHSPFLPRPALTRLLAASLSQPASVRSFFVLSCILFLFLLLHPSSSFFFSFSPSFDLPARLLRPCPVPTPFLPIVLLHASFHIPHPSHFALSCNPSSCRSSRLASRLLALTQLPSASSLNAQMLPGSS